jgi:hypothetical protein
MDHHSHTKEDIPGLPADAVRPTTPTCSPESGQSSSTTTTKTRRSSTSRQSETSKGQDEARLFP